MTHSVKQAADTIMAGVILPPPLLSRSSSVLGKKTGNSNRKSIKAARKQSRTTKKRK